MSKPRLHVGIVGAGLGGLAAAIGIARTGHQVTILEQAAVLSEVSQQGIFLANLTDERPKIGAGIQIPPNASRILKRWNILENIEAVSVRPSDFILRSYHDGRILSKQNMVPFAERCYGVPYLHIHRADYHKILVEEAERLGVKILLGSMVSGINFEKPAVQLAEKPDFDVDVILGADGINSVCRDALLGRPDPPHLTGDLAYRIIVKAEDMKKQPELQEFAEKPAINYWMGPRSHVVCYLLQGGSLYNIVMIAPDNLPELVNTAKADLQELRDLFQSWDPRLQKLLSLVQETSKWRLQNSEEMKSWSHQSGKFALVGAAQAIEDGAVLGSLFGAIERRSQIGDILTIFENLRKSRTTKVVKGSTTLRDIFHLQDGPMQQERDRQLTKEAPFEGFPNPWADPVFQPYLFSYDVEKEVEQAWGKYKAGGFRSNI
ncbi:MAG: hypothetical protein LQ351_006293 [Letrouitia transgressa]|nr:MAG: hypothetical protein LQ351_006293 [Letrouitia transgressa]